jgi:hypothetical protein
LQQLPVWAFLNNARTITSFKAIQHAECDLQVISLYNVETMISDSKIIV